MRSSSILDNTVAPTVVPFESHVSGFGFVEAIRIDPDGAIFFSDLFTGGFYKKCPGKPVQTLLPKRRWIGGSVLNVDGRIVLSGEGGVVILDMTTGIVEDLATTVDGIAIDSVNDMEADDDGAIYAGTVDFPGILDRGERGKPGSLIRIATDGQIETIREGVAVSNGMGFSPDRKTFYHSDFSVGVWAYEFERGGRPRNPRLIAQMEDSDGLVVDVEGGIWVASCNAAEVLRFLPTGALDKRIKLPFKNVVSLCFGGENLRKLFVATGGNDEAGRKTGGVVSIDCEVSGLPSNIGRIVRG